MLLDYTKRVYDLKINKINSKLVLSITNYIKHHIKKLMMKYLINSLILIYMILN